MASVSQTSDSSIMGSKSLASLMRLGVIDGGVSCSPKLP